MFNNRRNRRVTLTAALREFGRVFTDAQRSDDPVVRHTLLLTKIVIAMAVFTIICSWCAAR